MYRINHKTWLSSDVWQWVFVQESRTKSEAMVQDYSRTFQTSDCKWCNMVQHGNGKPVPTSAAHGSTLLGIQLYPAAEPPCASLGRVSLLRNRPGLIDAARCEAMLRASKAELCGRNWHSTHQCTSSQINTSLYMTSVTRSNNRLRTAKET